MKVGALSSPPKTGFKTYLASNKKLIYTWLGISFAAFALLKVLFPYPDFFSDSFSYVQDAVNNNGFGFRPQGYPEVLLFLKNLSPSAGLVTFTQYLLFTFSSMLCVMICGYLYRLTTRQINIVMGIILLNPVLLLITNLISSDSLFCSLTVFWFTSLLWVIRKTTRANIVVHALLLLACLHLRYTALFYCGISAIAFLVSNGKIVLRAAGVVSSLAVIFGYVNWQENKIEDKFNVRVFSGFSNWQIANNALCYYKKIDVKSSELPRRDSVIDLCVKKWIDNVYEDGHLGTQYMWNKKSPLRMYMALRGHIEKEKYFPEWIWCSKDIGDYGRALVKQNPLAYVEYFMFPNFKNYMVPDLEAVEDYNIYNLSLPKQTKEFYELDVDTLTPRFLHFERYLMAAFPYINCVLNMFNIFCIFIFLLLNWKRWKNLDRDIRGLFWVWTFFYFGYLLFSVASAYIVFRYLDIIFILGVIMPIGLYCHSYKSRWPALQPDAPQGPTPEANTPQATNKKTAAPKTAGKTKKAEK